MTVLGVVLTSGAEASLGPLDNRTLIDHAASALRGSGVVDFVSVAEPGGLAAALAGDWDIVVLHDAHRPLAPPSLVARVVEAVRAGADAAVPVVEVTETVKEVDAAGRIVRTVPRETLVQIQTPRAVRASLLGPAGEMPATAVTVPGAADAFGVHDTHDLALAAAVLAARR